MDDRTNGGGSAPAPGSAADGPVSEEARVDELPRALPWLPVRAGNYLVDDAGFNLVDPLGRAQLFVRWDEVTAVRFEGVPKRLHVDAAEPDGARTVVRAFAGPVARAAIGEAWCEHLLRRIELDGVLRGTTSPSETSRAPVGLSYAASAALVLMGVAFLWLWASATFRGGRSIQRLSAYSPRGLAPVVRWVLTCGRPQLLVLGAGPVALGAALVISARRLRRREAAMLARWKRWELSPDGLVFWPGGERAVLAPSKGDAVSRAEVRIGSERFWPRRMSGEAVLVPIMFALGERGGAALRPLWPAHYSAILALIAGFLGAVAALIYRLGGGVPVAVAVGGTTAALFLAGEATLVRRCRRFPMILAEGRAMLGRLGW